MKKDALTATAESIVDQIISDLCDRRGLKHEWFGIDENTQQEIRQTWIDIAERMIR
jgi:hypothetical protein